MRKCLILAVCAAALLPRSVLGIAASQAWVSNYVAQAISRSAGEMQATATVTTTNGVTVFVAGNDSVRTRLVVEDSSDAALLATNCMTQAVSAGVTNGCTFVWNGAGAYVNPLGVISCTPTNLVWGNVGSVATNGMERFEGWFDVRGVLIQPHTSHAITNGMMEVTR